MEVKPLEKKHRKISFENADEVFEETEKIYDTYAKSGMRENFDQYLDRKYKYVDLEKGEQKTQVMYNDELPENELRKIYGKMNISKEQLEHYEKTKYN